MSPIRGDLRTFCVVPSLPEPLSGLAELANNFWWGWNSEVFSLFRRMDPDLWERTNHNPVQLLAEATQERLAELAADPSYVAAVRRQTTLLREYLAAPTWFAQAHPELKGARIAYFSFEFGINQCLPIYSGGLGVLAGDHVKSASDLGLPLVGVGLLYREGYFRQRLGADGWQKEEYPETDFYTTPISLVKGADGAPITVGVEYPGRSVRAQIWRAQVGRIELFLLDTNVPENSEHDRNITARLYGNAAGSEERMAQEMMLGIGGVRALRALGIEPDLYHMNEGHCAFLALERCRMLVTWHRVPFGTAAEAVAGQAVFTTHTPVPAGNERFDEGLMRRFFHSYSQALGLEWDEFMALGREDPGDRNELFCLTVLAMKLSRARNGVSKLHAKVSRAMWRRLWPDTPLDEVPIAAITNGVHTRSWLSVDMATLLDRYLDPHWMDRPVDHAVWQRVDRIPDAELWRTHERRRERLVAIVRARLRAQLAQGGASPDEVAAAAEVLDPEALTIGFARRFATYKRGKLLFRDRERLLRLLSDRQRPVQLIFAGKAHPHDVHGKEFIRDIVAEAHTPEFRRRIVFLEDYDLCLAHYLASGVDAWLNTPRRPLEASGTSGMKIAANGGLNISVLDGWWDEGYVPGNGWAIGHAEEYADEERRDAVESRLLYDLLEKQVIPLFYDRGSDTVPNGWVKMMKAALRTINPVFNTNRMVHEYTERFYVPGIRRGRTLLADDLRRAAALAAWKQRLRDRWGKIRLLEVLAEPPDEVKVGDQFPVQARFFLGDVQPEEVTVQLYEGRLDARRTIVEPNIIEMACEGAGRPGEWRYAAQVACRTAGRHGSVFRVLPRHEDLACPHDVGLVFWA
ncbi:MAG TPA: alpha-glucan family phosphorylase [Planctomycetota bacterium]|nr:alpha-glucan family phosphorylase [Planctomycetota bacterium]HRR81604.1 alpha-glucan family phosphorylase [Planctomycetota bacterium]HRT93077.1 alpha-glucan family phosphorylase [Planctomycetota bacterium]